MSNSETTPIVCDSGLFQDNQESRFALGVFSADDVLNYEITQNPLIKGYLQLRANVYIDGSNILGAEARRPDGTELDEFDDRSVHFVAFEKRLGGAAVVASTRLIVKGYEGDLLPIEKTFKDKLPSSIIDTGVEVSRFIVNHSELDYRNKLKTKMMMAELAFVLSNQLGPVFGMVEAPFRRSLSMFGISSEALSELIPVEEGGKNGEATHITELMAIEISTDSMKRRFGEDAVKSMSMGFGDFIYWGKSEEVSEGN